MNLGVLDSIWSSKTQYPGAEASQIEPRLFADFVCHGRTKSANNQFSIWEDFAPGDCVLLDQMESSTPRFIAQLKGKLTKQSYRADTIFLDHHSDLTYVHLQQVLSSKETVEAKKVFEAYSHTYRVRIKHYHADNGHFVDNVFQ